MIKEIKGAEDVDRSCRNKRMRRGDEKKISKCELKFEREDEKRKLIFETKFIENVSYKSETEKEKDFTLNNQWNNF